LAEDILKYMINPSQRNDLTRSNSLDITPIFRE
jgi:hypothetical protein